MADSRQPIAGLPRPALGTSRLLTRGRVVINCFERGSGETVVLLPAFGRAASDYNELVAALNAADYRTVAVEFRGVGASTSPLWPRASLHDFAADVAHVVGARGGKVHVLGRAFGNRVARAFAADYPHLVRSLVLLGAGGRFRPSARVLLRYALGGSRLMPRRTRLRVIEETLYAPGNRQPPHLDYRLTFRAISRQMSAARRTPLEEWWHGGTAPILVLQGEQDRIAPPANAFALRDQFPDRVKVILVAGAGHALLPEQPEVVTREVIRFLRQHPLDTGSEAMSLEAGRFA